MMAVTDIRDWKGKIHYLALLLLLLLLCVRGAPRVNDESAYLLMADSLYTSGSTLIWNGLDEVNSPELRLHATRIVESEGGYALASIPSPVYSYIAYPLYALMGAKGLVVLNLLSFILSAYLVYLICERLFKDTGISLTTSLIFSLATYSIKYALDIWPHSLSVFLTLLPLTLILKSRSFWSLFLAGFSSGLAVGVRYPNILILSLLAAYLFFSSGKKNALSFIAGSLPPLAFMLSLNRIYGSLLITGYGDTTGSLYKLIFPFLILTALILLYKPLKKLLPRHVAILALALVLLLSWHYVRMFLSLVVDFSLNPRYHELTDKRALLQASPVLVLSVMGAMLVRKKINVPEHTLLLALSLTGPLFYSLLGLDGSTNLMRYFLESIPYLAIFAGYAVYEIRNTLKGMDYSVLAYVAFIILVVESTNLTAPAGLRYMTYKIPILLAFSTLLLFLKDKRHGLLLGYLIASLLIYSLILNLTFILDDLFHREYSMRQTDEYRALLPGNSALLYSGYLDQLPATPLKTEKTLRLAYLQEGDRQTNQALVDYYLIKNIPVYVLSGGNKSMELGVNFLAENHQTTKVVTLLNGDHLLKITPQ
ncbi:MAG: hypothetical protein V1744_05020 [Candidatus Altiarchaeota archaeon]